MVIWNTLKERARHENINVDGLSKAHDPSTQTGGNGRPSPTSPGVALINACPPMDNHGREWILTQTDQAGRYSNEE